MSARELKGLSKDIYLPSRMRSEKIRQMSERQKPVATGMVGELSVQMEHLCKELQRRDHEREELRTIVTGASTELKLVE